MVRIFLMVILIFSLILGGCVSNDDGDETTLIKASFTFESGDEGFSAGFADYPVGEDDFYGLESGMTVLPTSLGSDAAGYMIRGNNHSDDLFMFLKKHVGGEKILEAGQTYSLDMKIRIATNAGSGCTGIGGSPGESVYFKAGASGQEPVAADVGGAMTLNIDKGNQSDSGTDAIVIGDLANGTDDCSGETWAFKTLKLSDFEVTTDASGYFWILIGTDSGYEGDTTWYLDSVEITLTPVE